MLNIPEGAKKVHIFTGNILNLNEVTKKAGQDPSHELVEAVRLIADQGKYEDCGDGEFLLRGDTQDEAKDPGALLTSVKVFITATSPKESLKQSLHKVFTELDLSHNDSLILAYSGNVDDLEELVDMWSLLEEYALDKQLRIGLSDIDTNVFIKFFDMVKVKPSIIQINLASCCVVPPALQEFAKEKDITLLTHNDPLGLLTAGSLDSDSRRLSLSWAVRYQVHIKCRGVLHSKGYLLSLDVL